MSIEKRAHQLIVHRGIYGQCTYFTISWCECFMPYIRQKIYLYGYLNPILIGRFLPNIDWGGGRIRPPTLVSQKIRHIQGCVTHVYGPTFWARYNGIGFETLIPLQGRPGGLHDLRFWGLRGAKPTLKSKNMINQVVWIWQYQEPETNECRKSRRQKWNKNNLGFLVLPKTHLPVSNRAFHLSFILVKHLLCFIIYAWHLYSIISILSTTIETTYESQ